ncbi:CBS domain-containing protein [Marinactinospora thermotolerans]|uniref:Predicted signal-transduction protein containing cAMP-binding and CBS domains n=1 Tax=Marinactinospora thermotolerans DSM 45154 TaxID=1122192 RepID=A0A1T4SN40_9ACTN|nr:CBS domain-containing protein [Marinactinospora thermotolerans]SKA29556.1 Predicted signal-transduction protein containing cAMP-binding and CBS domains [Marinactinospora thermotolerans DSM 45154]
MLIAAILRAKGPAVVTVRPDTTIAHLLTGLARHDIGAAVVVDRDGRVVGVASERDIVRRLAEQGWGLLAARVRDIMTSPVTVCAPHDSVDSLALVMTRRRIRHIPVVSGERLAGVVSVGDVLKSRISQLEVHRDHLEAYITRG